MTKWDKIYSAESNSPTPCQVLADYAYLLPGTGVALDLACGLGGNALFLAKQGLTTHAWDSSQVAISQLNQIAKSSGLALNAVYRDVVECPPEVNTLDVLVVSHFLHRAMMPNLMSALKEDGLIFYQTFIQEKPESIGPKNPDFLLAANELLNFFPTLHLVVYHEEGLVGDLNQGNRNLALLVAQNRAKPRS